MSTPPLEAKTVIEVDGYLEPQVSAIIARYDIFRKWKDTINQTENGLDAFTKGYLKFGLNVDADGSVTYREWAPNAKEAYLIGDFSKHSQQNIFYPYKSYRRMESHFPRHAKG